MAQIHFHLETRLAPEAVLAVLTDFGPRRATVWPNDSNIWGPGSRWDYKLMPTAQGGTEIEVTVRRHGKGWKGRLIELGLAVGGARVLRSQMEQVLARSAS